MAYSPEQIDRAIRNAEAAGDADAANYLRYKYGLGFESQQPVAPVDQSGGFVPALKVGGAQVLQALARPVEEITGLDTGAGAFAEEVRQENPLTFTSLGAFAESPYTATKEIIGQQVAPLAAIVGGAAGGRALGAAAGAVPGLRNIPLPARQKAGEAAGAFLSSLALQYDEAREAQEQSGIDDPLRALAGATPAAALELLGAESKLRKIIFGGDKRAGARLAEAAKTAAVTAPTEAATEVGQGSLTRWAGGQPILDPEAMGMEALGGAIGGGVAGGVLGAVTPAAAKTEVSPTPPAPEEDEADVDPAEFTAQGSVTVAPEAQAQEAPAAEPAPQAEELLDLQINDARARGDEPRVQQLIAQRAALLSRGLEVGVPEEIALATPPEPEPAIPGIKVGEATPAQFVRALQKAGPEPVGEIPPVAEPETEPVITIPPVPTLEALPPPDRTATGVRVAEGPVADTGFIFGRPTETGQRVPFKSRMDAAGYRTEIKGQHAYDLVNQNGAWALKAKPEITETDVRVVPENAIGDQAPVSVEPEVLDTIARLPTRFAALAKARSLNDPNLRVDRATDGMWEVRRPEAASVVQPALTAEPRTETGATSVAQPQSFGRKQPAPEGLTAYPTVRGVEKFGRQTGGSKRIPTKQLVAAIRGGNGAAAVEALEAGNDIISRKVASIAKASGIAPKIRVSNETETSALPDRQLENFQTTKMFVEFIDDADRFPTNDKETLAEYARAKQQLESAYGSVDKARERVRAGPPRRTEIGGTYSPALDEITVAESYNDTEWERVYSHELAHAVSTKLLKNPQTTEQRQAAAGLSALYDYLKANQAKLFAAFSPNGGARFDAEFDAPYGLTSFEEFYSEAFSNPKFQARLSKISYTNTTAWGKFTEFVAKLLGLSNDNAFTEFLSLSEKLESSNVDVAIPGEQAKVPQESAPVQEARTDDTPSGVSSIERQAAPAEEAAQPRQAQGKVAPPASWVIRNKQTGEVIAETFDRKKVDALNTAKYEAVPIREHLAGLNKKAAEPAPAVESPKPAPVQSKPKGKPLTRIKVKRGAIDENSGRRMKVTERADLALQDVDSQIDAVRSLIQCLES